MKNKIFEYFFVVIVSNFLKSLNMKFPEFLVSVRSLMKIRITCQRREEQKCNWK